MALLSHKIMGEVAKQPGITDRALAEAIFGVGTPQQRVNGECRRLASKGLLTRVAKNDGLMGNYLAVKGAVQNAAEPEPTIYNGFVLLFGR